MEIMNKTYKKILKSDLKLTTILHNDLSFNKNINFLDYNSKMGYPQNFSKKNKLFFSKNCTTPSRLLKNSIINLSTKNNNNKIDASTQKNFYKKNTKNFLKILIEKIPNKNNNEIDYVLESPHRGVEKIQYAHDIKGKNFFKPVFIDNAYNGYFCKNKEKINFTMNNNGKKIFIDKYNEINKNKEINNPLKKLSQLSGLSCYKLRKFIDYSLNNKPKHKFIFLGKKEKNKKNFLKKDNRYNNFKNIYSFITLKSKKNIKFKMIKDNFPLDNEGSLDNNVIYPKRIYEIKRFIDISKNDNDIYK